MFKTYKTPGRALQVCFVIDDWQGDGYCQFSFTLLERSFAAGFDFNGTKYPKPRIDWRLFRR